MLRKLFGAKFNLVENFTYVLRDKNGNVKPMFALNKLGQFLMKKGMISPNTSKALLSAFMLGGMRNEMHIANLITNTGMAGVASRINGSGAEAAFTYVAIGIGAVASAVTDTALGSEIVTGGGERAVATASRTTTDVTDDTATLVLTYNFTATFAVTEAGALNAGAAGVLLNRQVFSAVNVANGDSLQVTIDIDVD
ncbi:hypothetical protein KAU11_10270 [Candidatus Babeliales bacterium]|nr:hypothetical protein [Candidatus Babeliales bacterium]